jgi:peptidoglycan hydrolase-like protein with peptidoglycan-binding domain/2'-5' RNA ligase
MTTAVDVTRARLAAVRSARLMDPQVQQILRARGARSNPAPGRQVISPEGADRYGLAVGATIVPGTRLLTAAQRVQYDALDGDDRKRYQSERAKGATHPQAMKAAGGDSPAAGKVVAAKKPTPRKATAAEKAAPPSGERSITLANGDKATLAPDEKLVASRQRWGGFAIYAIRPRKGGGIDDRKLEWSSQTGGQRPYTERQANKRLAELQAQLDGGEGGSAPVARKSAPRKSTAKGKSTPAVAAIASAFHEDWRKTRRRDDGTFEPRVKKTQDKAWVDAHGTDDVDIANTTYEDLPDDWKAENRAAAEVVAGILARHGGSVDLSDPPTREKVGEEIHQAWLSRNDWAKGGDLDVPFKDLPADEQAKDIDQVAVAMRVAAPKKATPRAAADFDPADVAERIHRLGPRGDTEENVRQILAGHNAAQLRRVATAFMLRVPKDPPVGHPRWTADLLTDYIVQARLRDRTRYTVGGATVPVAPSPSPAAKVAAAKATPPRLSAEDLVGGPGTDKAIVAEVQDRLDDGESPADIAKFLRAEAAKLRSGAERRPDEGQDPRYSTSTSVSRMAGRYEEAAARLEGAAAPAGSPSKAAKKGAAAKVGTPQAETSVSGALAALEADLRKIPEGRRKDSLGGASPADVVKRYRERLTSGELSESQVGGLLQRLLFQNSDAGGVPDEGMFKFLGVEGPPRADPRLATAIHKAIDDLRAASPAARKVAAAKATTPAKRAPRAAKRDAADVVAAVRASQSGREALSHLDGLSTTELRQVATRMGIETKGRTPEALRRDISRVGEANFAQSDRPTSMSDIAYEIAGMSPAQARAHLLSLGFTDEEIDALHLPGIGQRSRIPDVDDVIRAEYDNEHTGAMIALVPSQKDAERLAVDGGEPAGDLHVTLLLLADADDYDDDQRADILDTARQIANDLGDVVEAEGFSLSLFNPKGDDPCIVLGLTGEDVAAAHDLAEDAVDDLDLDLPDQHTPYAPHVTLVYTDDPGEIEDLTDLTGPVVLDRIRVAFGNEVHDFPLGDAQRSDGDGDEEAEAEAEDEEYTSRAMAVSDKPWSQFTQADYDDEQWYDACLIHTNEGDNYVKADCKLPVREPDGTLNRNGVHAAAGRLRSVDASAEQKQAAARELVRLYRQLDEDPPPSLVDMSRSVEPDDEEVLRYQQATESSWTEDDEQKHPRGSGAQGGQFVKKGTPQGKPKQQPPARKQPPKPQPQRKPGRAGTKPKPINAEAKRRKRGTIAAGTGSGVAGGDPDVRALQDALRHLGLATGKPNGVLGGNTIDAVKEVQRRLGLRPTGRVSVSLIRKVENAAKLSNCAQRSEPVDPDDVSRAMSTANMPMAPSGHAAYVDGRDEPLDEVEFNGGSVCAYPNHVAVKVDGVERARFTPDTARTVADALADMADTAAESDETEPDTDDYESRSTVDFWTAGPGRDIWLTSATPFAVLQDRLEPELGTLAAIDVAIRCVVDTWGGARG